MPKSAEVFALEGFKWVCDAHYVMHPQGVSAEKVAVLLDLMNHLSRPQQAYALRRGYFYPGPARR